MKLMPCPLNGLRDITEFVCGGEVKTAPDSTCSDDQWSDYVFMTDNPRGLAREWWCHTPSNTWFICESDTVTERIVATYLPTGSDAVAAEREG